MAHGQSANISGVLVDVTPLQILIPINSSHVSFLSCFYFLLIFEKSIFNSCFHFRTEFTASLTLSCNGSLHLMDLSQFYIYKATGNISVKFRQYNLRRFIRTLVYKDNEHFSVNLLTCPYVYVIA